MVWNLLKKKVEQLNIAQFYSFTWIMCWGLISASQQELFFFKMLHVQPLEIKSLIFRSLPTEDLTPSQAWHNIKYFDLLSEKRAFDRKDEKFIEDLVVSAHKKVQINLKFDHQKFYKLAPLAALYCLRKLSPKTEQIVKYSMGIHHFFAEAMLCSPCRQEIGDACSLRCFKDASALHFIASRINQVFAHVITCARDCENYYNDSGLKKMPYLFMLRDAMERFWLLQPHYDIENVRSYINKRLILAGYKPIENESKIIEYCILI